MGCFNSKVSNDLNSSPKKSVHGKKAQPQETSQTRLSGESNKLSLKLVSDGTMSVKTLTFKHVMADPLGREYFMKFLQIEHAEENLTFFQEVENIKKVDAKDLVQSAEELVESYLKPGVETEVNVSDNMKKSILNLVTKGETAEHQAELMRYLDKAQNEILMIMAMGAFPRFMKSRLFVDYKRKVRELEEKDDLFVRAAESTHPNGAKSS